VETNDKCVAKDGGALRPIDHGDSGTQFLSREVRAIRGFGPRLPPLRTRLVSWRTRHQERRAPQMAQR
jgi:hypothetical protein